MLLGMDEFPYHQFTNTFAAVAGSDPQWNDGHYVTLCDAAGTVCLTSNVRLYQNNDVLDGFVCIRHGGRQYNVRLSRRLRPNMDHLGVGPLRIELIEPMQVLRMVLDDNDVLSDQRISLDVTCRTTAGPHLDPIETTRIDGRLISERATYEVTGECTGWVSVGGQRIELATASFFRNHSWGYQPGRGGARSGAPVGGPRRLPGVRQWVLFHMPDHGGYYFADPRPRAAAGKGAIMIGDRSIDVHSVSHDLHFYDGGRRLRSGTFELIDSEGTPRSYEVEDLGWVYCQGGGYFGGFDDRLGQGVYRGDYHEEGDVWDVSHPTQIVDASGRTFEFDHAWAESFVRVRSGESTGLGHFECVVIS
ncbi:MAG: hypothetical protein ABI862_18840 [Ilumatobacteraceae bacterium]